jgi:hypothetical protein
VHLWTKYGNRTLVAASTAIVLVFCVFLWGLEYKLSLYHPPHSFARLVPIAKLLSKNEQPRIAARSIAVAVQSVSIPRFESISSEGLLFLAALCFFGTPAVGFWNRQTIPARMVPALPLRAFFVRPPPVAR